MSITFLHMYVFTYAFFFSDTNECSYDNDGCSQTCINTKGSFYCECQTGYELNSDAATCNGEYYMKHTHVRAKKHNICVQNHTYITIHLNIDECSDGNGGCSQTCTNTVGSFNCGCNSDFVLDFDVAICNGVYKHDHM